MPDPKPKAVHEYESRLTGEYIANQVLQFRAAERHQDHKKRINDADAVYAGDLSKYRSAGEASPKDWLLIENKYKNAVHDLARLASEPRPTPVFMQKGDSVAEYKKARVREQIADTIWEMGNGPRIQRKLYMDFLGAGYASIALHFNEQSDYAQFMRLDPRYCYPDVRNNTLQTMLYVEAMPAGIAKRQWPDLADKLKTDDKKDVTIATYYDENETAQAVVETSGKKVIGGYVVQNWPHQLGCVPVAWVPVDTFDSTFRGVFDQVGGPMALRNRIMSMLDDYMEDMVHSPYEAKNIMNADDPPGPLTIFEHDPYADESFLRRVAPASPAGAVFGVLQYMDGQESVEALQPPSRVGNVRQSIASGDFVNSTQGALSSAVREIQEDFADLRKQVHYIAFKIEEKYLDHEKGLMRSVGERKTYLPSKDIDGVYEHRILFGAAAGNDRQYADVRVLQHVGSGLISKKTGRSQLDYIDDPTSEQNWIDQEQLATILFQRFSADPNTPLSSIAESLVEMGKGKNLVEVMEIQAKKMAAAEAAAQAAQQGAAGEQLPAGEPGVEPGAEAAALDKGQVPEGGAAVAPIKPFSPAPLAQVFVGN